MVITHVSSVDIRGGAAIAAFRLHRGLLQRGYDSEMYVQGRYSHDPTVRQHNGPRGSLVRQVSRKLRDRVEERIGSVGQKVGQYAPGWASLSYYNTTRPDGLDVFSHARVHRGHDVIQHMPKCDVINLHWISNFIDIELLTTNVPAATPIIWTLHDMNPFTGGCHYSAGCQKYQRICGACPQLGSTMADDLSMQIWQHKERAFLQRDARNLHIVAPSRWLANEAKRSALLSRFPVTVIPYGLDVDNFRPRDRQLAREILAIPPSAKVLLFVAAYLNNRRKGFALLLEALKTMTGGENLFLLSLGQHAADLPDEIPSRHLDSIGDERMISLVYSAADLFVIPSLEDNLPNTVLESMACGTPVVGFDVGGIPDMVRPGITGELIPVGDIAALRRVIEAMLDAPERRKELSINCRRVVEQEYASDVQAQRYVALYQEMLSQVGA